MTDCDFQIEQHEDTRLTGHMHVQVVDLDGNPNSVLCCDKGGRVVVHWGLHGHLTRHLCGSFCVCVHMEGLGGAPDYDLETSCKNVEMEPCGDGHYEVTFDLPPNTQACENLGCGGALYKISVTLTSLDPCGNPGHIQAYCEAGTVMFARCAHE